jgi:diaminohydroxyphosphoribosylaminopyrimidine deaminase/5-amino-6-(5-phosphoribosylamino)uracil reductase
MLRAAGIEVTTGVLADEAARDLAGFFARVEKGRPALTLKLANSFDGRIATATGESQWITGPEARRHVHAMRASHDAVMVGGGTARTDDPSLTVRDMGISRQPVRVVLSRRLDLPLTGKLAMTACDVPVWICHGPDLEPVLERSWRDLGAELIRCPLSRGQIDTQAALQALGERGLTRVFCEGGGALAASLLTRDLVDDLVGYTAGLAIGAEGLPGIGAMGLERLGVAPRYDLMSTRQVGKDVVHHWHRR